MKSRRDLAFTKALLPALLLVLWALPGNQAGGQVPGAPENPQDAGEAVLPEGRAIIQNGSFSGRGRPEHWLTRATGELGAFDLTPVTKGSKDNVLKVTVSRESDKPWNLELRQKIESNLEKGETVYFSFDYKLTPGYAFHIYWQKDSSPWPKYLSLRISEPMEQWHTCKVAVPVHEDLASSTTAVSFHLAELTGELQLRNFTATAYAADLDVSKLPVNVEPTFGGDYYDKDWRDAATARLRKTRMGALFVKVTEGGKPVKDAEIEAVQTSRPFAIGVDAPAALLVEGALESAPFADLRKRVGDDASALPKYRSIVLESGLFDTVTLPDALIWSNHEKWGKDIAPEAIKLVRDAGLRVHGHSLHIPAYRYAPPDMRKLKIDSLYRAVNTHIQDMTRTYRGIVDVWDVLHGVLSYQEMYEPDSVECLVQAYQVARNGDPDAVLLLSDERALRSPSIDQLAETLELLNWLRGQGANIFGLALSASLVRPYIAPQAMQERLDLVGTKSNVPVFITSLQLDVENEREHAHMLGDLMLAFYSNPIVHGVSFTNLWEAAASRTPKASLYRRNMAIKPAGKALRNLLETEWLTKAKTTSGDEGTAKIVGYHGDYRVTVRHNGKEKTVQTRIDGGGDDEQTVVELD